MTAMRPHHDDTQAPAGPPAEPQSTSTDWFAAGQRDWDLGIITATHSDDTVECEEARDERENVRNQIDGLDQRELRDYLYGVLSQMEMYLWHGLAHPEH